MSLWTVLVLAGLGSLALRLSFLVAPARLRLPDAWERLADLVYPAAMAAILGGVLHGLAAAGLATGDARRLLVLAPAALVTAVVSRTTGSVLGALGAGLGVVFALSLLF